MNRRQQRKQRSGGDLFQNLSRFRSRKSFPGTCREWTADDADPAGFRGFWGKAWSVGVIRVGDWGLPLVDARHPAARRLIEPQRTQRCAEKESSELFSAHLCVLRGQLLDARSAVPGAVSSQIARRLHATWLELLEPLLHSPMESRRASAISALSGSDRRPG